MTAIECWKARIVLPKAEADALAAALEGWDGPPVVSNFETGERDLWEVEAFFAEEPAAAALAALTGRQMRVTAVPKQDWVALSLDGIPPVQAGRFFVHGRHGRSRKPQNAIGLEIEASTAFGTGHHGTTRGCLLALQRLGRRYRFRRVLDLGCGTGVLAFAAARLMQARCVASDIDPVAAAKAREFARANGAAALVGAIAAAGFGHPRIGAAAPYDLIFANILMKPLMRLMPGIAAHVRPGGIAVLSGLLAHQERAIMAYARAHGFSFRARDRLEGWVTLTVVKAWHHRSCPDRANAVHYRLQTRRLS
jgi:ribosomal protein L11 methyltransferase